MSTRGIIIQGSSRSKGNTNKIVGYLVEVTGFDYLDLLSKNIKGFDYKFQNSDDDFIPLIRSITENYDTVVFATPVYWYSMSGILKNFFDRISDCLKTEKELGRKLRGIKMGAVSCGSDDEIIEGFDVPFSRSAKYLGMQYLGYIHTWIENDVISGEVKSEIMNFAYKLKN